MHYMYLNPCWSIKHPKLCYVPAGIRINDNLIKQVILGLAIKKSIKLKTKCKFIYKYGDTKKRDTITLLLLFIYRYKDLLDFLSEIQGQYPSDYASNAIVWLEKCVYYLSGEKTETTISDSISTHL